MARAAAAVASPALATFVDMFSDEYWAPNATAAAASGAATATAVVQPTNAIERAWLGITTRLSEFQLFLAFYGVVLGIYLSSAAVLALCSHFGWLERYKIQWRRDWPEAPDYKKCLKNIAFNYLVCALPLGALSFPIMKAFGLTSALPLPQWHVFALHMFIFLVVEDALHYALHRALHIPLLYKHIHKVHHEFAAPVGLSASYSTVWEMLILAVPTFAPAMLMAPHFFTFYCWFVLRQFDAVLRHCGYDLPDPLELIPYYGGTRFHDYHHESFNWNFASRFTYLDKIAGTYKVRPGGANRADAEAKGLSTGKRGKKATAAKGKKAE